MSDVMGTVRTGVGVRDEPEATVKGDRGRGTPGGGLIRKEGDRATRPGPTP